MAKRTLAAVVSITLLALCGCGNQEVQPPRIVGTVAHIEAQPAPPAPVSRTWEPSSPYPPGWIPPRAKERKWTAIIVHHSATDRGNVAAFDEYHRTAHNWDGVGYDFVIGNGNGSGDGQVEVTYRWRDQVPGAHVGGTYNNWANVNGVGICLVGDFTKTRPTPAQMKSLTTLVRFLQKRYGIRPDKVYGHCETPGYTGKSVCPGPYFPMRTFRNSL